jgi:hypothetical protein
VDTALIAGESNCDAGLSLASEGRRVFSDVRITLRSNEILQLANISRPAISGKYIHHRRPRPLDLSDDPRVAGHFRVAAIP